MDRIKHLLITGEPLHTYCGKILTNYNDGVFEFDSASCNCEKCLEYISNIQIVVFERLLYQWKCPICSTTNTIQSSQTLGFPQAQCKSCNIVFKRFRKLGIDK